jgi:hypothetical protein
MNSNKTTPINHEIKQQYQLNMKSNKTTPVENEILQNMKSSKTT